MNGLDSETSTDDVCTEKKQNGNRLNLETSTDDDVCAKKKENGIPHGTCVGSDDVQSALSISSTS